MALGVDIGGTKIAVGLVGATGVVRERASTPAPSAARDVEQAALQLVREVVADTKIEAIGIGCPGTIDPYTGRVVASDSKPGLEGANVGDVLTAEFDVPFAVTNDANAAGVGELAYGAATGFSRVLVISVGTGVGAALLLDGRLEEGMNGTAGEIAHLLVPPVAGGVCGCGRSDHLEAVASGSAIAAAYAVDGPPLTGAEIAAQASAGDERAAAVIVNAGRTLGRCVAGLANAVDIDAVVLTGGVARCSAYFDAAKVAFTGEVMAPLRRVPVLRGALGADAPIVGAATYVRARLGI